MSQPESRYSARASRFSIGLGLTASPGSFGHGGAYATSMSVDTNRGLITIWMVQHAGFISDGNQALDRYRKAVEALQNVPALARKARLRSFRAYTDLLRGVFATYVPSGSRLRPRP